jgi:tetratricopeptide (TPR) repeat protein
VALGQGKYEPAADLLDKSVVLLRDLKDQSGVTFLVALGTVQRCQGDLERAKMTLEESVSSFRRIGQNYRAADSLCQLGIIARLEGNLGQAAALLQESLSVGSRDKYGVSRCLEALAGVACQQGELMRGTNLFGAADAMRERIAAPLDPFDIDDHDMFIAAAQARLGDAGFRQAWLEGQTMTQEEAIAFASDQPITPVVEGRIT